MQEQTQEKPKSFFEQFKDLPLILKRPAEWTQDTWKEYQRYQNRATKQRLKGQYAIISSAIDPKSGKRMSTKPYVKVLHDPATR